MAKTNDKKNKQDCSDNDINQHAEQDHSEKNAGENPSFENKWEKILHESDHISTKSLDGQDDNEVAQSVDADMEFSSTPEDVSATPFAEDQRTVALQLEIKELKDKNLYISAQSRNIEERAQREIRKAKDFANTEILKELLQVIDSLDRALAIPDPSNEQAISMMEGMKLTQALLEKVLIKHGVEVINPAVGVAFNPDHHEAMTMQKIAGAEPNTVVDVLQKGYMLNGRVIRAAMVVVAQ